MLGLQLADALPSMWSLVFGQCTAPPHHPWREDPTLCQVFLLPQAVMRLSNDWQLRQVCVDQNGDWNKGGGFSWLSFRVIFIKEI